jgi:hypothetical protein
MYRDHFHENEKKIDCNLMGTLCSRQSQNPPKSSMIDPSSYLLGNNPGEKNFDTNQLNFVPDSEQQWNPPLTLPVLKRSISPINIPSTDMLTHQKYKCDQCGMIFPSNESLFKHKTRFCIGVKDSGIGRQPVYSDDEQIEDHTKRSTVRKIVRHQSPIQKVIFRLFILLIILCFSKKREEVNEWKRQRAILQTVEDMEDRIKTDSFRTQKLTNEIKNQDHIYNEILLEVREIFDHTEKNKIIKY